MYICWKLLQKVILLLRLPKSLPASLISYTNLGTSIAGGFCPMMTEKELDLMLYFTRLIKGTAWCLGHSLNKAVCVMVISIAGCTLERNVILLTRLFSFKDIDFVHQVSLITLQ